MNSNYKPTIIACFVGYIVQAIINNFAPLLFLTFQSSFKIPLSQITMLVTINFCVQLLVDFLSAYFVDAIGYRMSMIIANLFSAAGLFLLAVLPSVMPSAFAGLLISVVLYALGGGLLEVLVSPIMEACPTDNKEQAMSLLHSFYCWGHVGVVALSTLFFKFFGIANWRILAMLWTSVPIATMIAFMKVPIAPLIKDGEKGLSLKQLFSMKMFWILMIMMMCAGASEQSVSQWMSAFAEKGLGVSKMIGDLAGPMLFAIMMGTSRAFYGKFGGKINLDRFMTLSALLCITSYVCIAFIPLPAVNLACCALCGLSVGIMWPGTFSIAVSSIRNGGTALFALLALAGDLGCSSGPTVVGMVSNALHDNLHWGILVAIIFPFALFASMQACKKNRLPD